MSTTVHERLQAAASKNADLLRTISETGYSTSALQQSNNYIANAKKQLALEEKNLKEADKAVDKEFKDHKKYRDSHVRRLAHKWGGKKEEFAAEATKEEKEWLDAVAVQLRCKNAIEKLKKDLDEATKQSAELLDVVQVHNQTVLELDALYNSIFDGPNPAIPEEDIAENEMKKVQNDFNIVQMVVNTEKQAQSIIHDVDTCLKRAIQNINDAESAANLDAWGFDGFSEMQEQSSLSMCTQNVHQAQMLMGQAQRVQPEIKMLPDVQIAQMNIMTNVVFDNIFSDMNMLDRIDTSARQLRDAHQALARELAASNERLRKDQSESDAVKVVLDQKRLDLQNVRKAAFERLANEGYDERGLPPAYDKAVAA